MSRYLFVRLLLGRLWTDGCHTIIYHQVLWMRVREEPHWQGASFLKLRSWDLTLFGMWILGSRALSMNNLCQPGGIQFFIKELTDFQKFKADQLKTLSTKISFDQLPYKAYFTFGNVPIILVISYFCSNIEEVLND